MLGIWAAQNDTVSRILRPINDTLQTMPQFVFLIPALMLFKVGEFTALFAIVLYAIVPPIRYVEQGLRTVPTDVVEAARQMGTTADQCRDHQHRQGGHDRLVQPQQDGRPRHRYFHLPQQLASRPLRSPTSEDNSSSRAFASALTRWRRSCRDSAAPSSATFN